MLTHGETEKETDLFSTDLYFFGEGCSGDSLLN